MNSLRKTAVLGLPFILGILLVWSLFSVAEAESENIIIVCPTFCAYTAIQAAIDGAEPHDLIVVNSGIYTENLVITKSLKLLGEGYESTIIDGNELDRVLMIDANVVVEMTGFTLRRGRAPLDEENNAMGGGVYNLGELRLVETAVVNNVAQGAHGYDASEAGYGFGGGIYNLGSIDIKETTIAKNASWCGLLEIIPYHFACAKGGAIYTNGRFTATNSAIYENESDNGGGIFSTGISHTYLQNVTVSNNWVRGDGGGVVNRGEMTLNFVTISKNGTESYYSHDPYARGGGLFNQGNLSVKNSILSKNQVIGSEFAVSGPDCYGTLLSGGYNLIGDTSDCTISGNNEGIFWGNMHI